METAMNTTMEFLRALAQRFGSYLPNALGALLILVFGGLLARLLARGAARFVRRILEHPRFGPWMGAGEDPEKREEARRHAVDAVEKIAFAILSLILLVVFFSVLQVPALSSALSVAIADLTAYIPNLLAAAIVFLVAWVLARVLRSVVRSILSSLKWTRDLEDRVTATESRRLPDAVGGLVFWLVLLFAVPAFLQALSLDSLGTPFEGLIEEILGAIPRIAVAAFVLFVGLLFARISRNVVVHFLDAVGMEGWLERVGLGGLTRRVQLHRAIGTIIYILVLLPVLEHALDRLDVEAVSDPLRQIIGSILGIIPPLLSAVLLLGIGVILGRWLGELCSRLLSELGFDALWPQLGIGRSDDADRFVRERRLSLAVGRLVSAIVIVLLAAQAFQVLDLEVLSVLLSGLVAYLPQVLIAVVIVGVAFYLGRVLASAVAQTTSGRPGLGWLSAAARLAVLTVGFVMALNQLEVGGDVLADAFIILLAAAGLALSLAFGLGGREWAARKVEGLERNRTRGSEPGR